MVWKASKEFGIGKAKTKDGKWFTVANYYPAGNLVGSYADNVFGPTDGKIVVPKPEGGAGGGASPTAADDGKIPKGNLNYTLVPDLILISGSLIMSRFCYLDTCTCDYLLQIYHLLILMCTE